MDNRSVFIFPGSGSQYTGMASQQYRESEIVRKTFQEADEILGRNISDIILEGSTLKLNRIRNMFISIYVVSVAYFRRYIYEGGVLPEYMAGHSLGEYSALTCSGAISFDECLRIVDLRSRIAEDVMKSTDGAMTILKNISPKYIEELCEKVAGDGKQVSIACYNSPSQVSISGEDSSLRIVEQMALEKNSSTQVINLIGSAPYHCKLMEPKAPILKDELRKCHFKQGKCKVISNVSGKPYSSEEEIIELLSLQLYNPVQWNETINYLVKENVNTAIEFGPQNVLKNLMNENTTKIMTYAYDEQLDRDIIKRIFYKKEESDDEKSNKIKAITMCITHASSLRNFNPDTNFDNTKSRMLYEKVRKIKKDISSNNREVSVEDVDLAFEMLKEAFEAKMTDEKERELRVNMIIEKCNLDAKYNEIVKRV